MNLANRLARLTAATETAPEAALETAGEPVADGTTQPTGYDVATRPPPGNSLVHAAASPTSLAKAPWSDSSDRSADPSHRAGEQPGHQQGQHSTPRLEHRPGTAADGSPEKGDVDSRLRALANTQNDRIE